MIPNETSGNISDAWSQVFGWDHPTWSLGLEFLLPVGLRQERGEYQRREAEVQRAAQLLVDAERQLEEEVRASHREIVNGTARLEAAEYGVNAALEQVRIGMIEFRNGRITAFELVRLGADMASAQQRYSDALVRTAKAAARLRQQTSGRYPDRPNSGGGVRSMTDNSYACRTVVLLILLLAVPGCSGPPAGGGGFTMPPTPVEAAQAVTEPVVDHFQAVGTIEAEKAITVVSEINGVVVELPFREGAPISRGGLIARLDGTQLEAELARAEALLAQKQSIYDRIKAVVDQSAGSPQDLDDAAAARKVAEADLALARARLDKTRITAPFGGMLGARRVSPGAYLRAGEAITDLARITEIRINFSAPERYLGRLNRGAEVTISTTAFPGYQLTGEIIVVEPLLDAATRSARLVARVNNPEGKFRPGMSADVSAVLGERLEALTIPNEAVFVDGNQTYVFEILDGGTVTRRAVSLGTRLAASVEVIRGLEPGARGGALRAPEALRGGKGPAGG